MAVKIRLARHGAKKAPFYRVVIADGRARRDGRFIEIVGRYNPLTTPSTVELNLETIDAWIAKGAQPTEAVAKLIDVAKGVKAAPVAEVRVSKKAAAKAADEAAAAVKAAEEAAAAAAKAAEEAAAAAEAPVEDVATEDAPAEAEVVEDATADEATTEDAE